MNRRDLMMLIGGAVAWPVAARAQQGERVRRVGVLFGSSEIQSETAAALKEGLAKLGWLEGRNLQIELRVGEADFIRLRAYADELVRLAPDVLFASGNIAARALQQQTQTIPIVFVGAGAVVEGNTTVRNIIRPEANITGFANKDESIEGKWLELLKEVAPRIARVDFVYFDTINANVLRREIGTIETAARALGVEVTSTPFHEGAAIERAIETFAVRPNGGLIVNSNVITQRDSILRLAARYQLPLIAAVKSYPVGGGLMSYGTDLATLHREAAGYVDRILRGAKPSDLPVQLPTKYDLVINIKTANALGLMVPPSMQQLADEVIE
jgi:putative tryptophan/tyrosine transport system substrate-binding protein